MKSRRTVVEKVSAGSTVGKNRRKIVADCIDLADLGCHAFKDGTIPASRSVMKHNLSSRVRVAL
jgi:hypothetical protein